MQKKFLTNLVFLIIVNLLVKPFWVLGVDREVQNTVGTESYGFYFALFNYSFLFHIILDLGISYYNTRKIVANNHLLSIWLPNILLLKTLLSLIYLAITFAGAFLLNFHTIQIKLLALLGINQILISLVLYLRSNISGLLYLKTDSILSVLDKLLLIIICGSLLWGNVTSQPFQIEWLIYAQTFSYTFTALTTFVIIIILKTSLSIKWDPAILIQILKKSYPYALVVLLMTLYTKIDGVMIERLLENGAYQAGIYAAAYRLLDAVNMIGLLFAAILLPMFAKMIKNKEPVNELLALSFKFIFVGVAILSITAFFFKNQIMALLYTETSPYIANVFGILILCSIATAATYIFGTLLSAKGTLKQFNRVAALGVILNIILNYVLILKYEAMGATIATLATQSMTGLAFVLIVQRLFGLKTNFKLLVLMLIFIGGIIAANITLQNLWQDWRISFLFVILISILWAFTLKLIDLKKIFGLF